MDLSDLGISVGMKAINPYKTDKEFTDECVRSFLLTSSLALDGARGEERTYLRSGHSFRLSKVEEADLKTRSWADLSTARLFMVRPEHWVSMYVAADRLTTKLALDEEWAPYHPSNPVEPDKQMKLMEFYEKEGAEWPFPDPLPFESCFFSYGSRLLLSDIALATRVLDSTMKGHDVYLLGNLVVKENERANVYSFMLIDGKEFSMGILNSYHDGKWSTPMSLDPWILNGLVRNINMHKHIVQEQPLNLTNRLDRKASEKKAKRRLPLPVPFYRIDLKDELIIEPPQLQRHRAPANRLVEWAHRWDVRGHECIRYERGPSPIPERKRKDLLKRGYRVYDNQQLSAADAERLMKRGVSHINVDEWIAVLSYWQQACIKGPTDKPYVPGARL